MRTKALLGLAALAVGLSTSVAQNVYSLNVVGYVNISLQANKLHFLSLPLNDVNGNYNITNTIVLDTTQDFATIYTWAGTSYSPTAPVWYGTDIQNPPGWVPSITINPGVGFFLASQAASTLTFVGQVPQGVISYTIPVGISTLANQIPVSTNFPGSTVGNDFDSILTWDLANQKFSTTAWAYYGTDIQTPPGWSNGTTNSNLNGPLLNPGDAVFYETSAGNPAITFTQNFTVQ